MPEDVIVILNPRAGAGRAERQSTSLREALRSEGIRPEFRRTTSEGHATELVREALRSGAPGVAVVGGDGTLNEAVNGYFEPDGTLITPGAWLAPLPCGTGGDFRKSAQIPKSIHA
ncbi:MAG: diacylglycerol kinase family protein, partial [Myxococcota bacterium]